MGSIIKLLLIVAFLLPGCWVGYYLYKIINTRLKDSDSGWMIFFYAVLLFVILGALSAVIIFLTVYAYDFLGQSGDPVS